MVAVEIVEGNVEVAEEIVENSGQIAQVVDRIEIVEVVEEIAD